MRHNQHRHKLGVKTAHRAALLSNLAAALLRHKRIRTTQAKAKALRPFVERVITLAKKGYQAETPEARLHFRRLALSRVRDPEAVRLLFQERVEEFLNREGGYTRIYKLVPRRGDAADMALIELIDADDEGYTKPKKKSRKRSRKGEAAPAAVSPAAAGADAPAEAAETGLSPEAAGEEEAPPVVEEEAMTAVADTAAPTASAESEAPSAEPESPVAEAEPAAPETPAGEESTPEEEERS